MPPSAGNSDDGPRGAALAQAPVESGLDPDADGGYAPYLARSVTPDDS